VRSLVQCEKVKKTEEASLGWRKRRHLHNVKEIVISKENHKNQKPKKKKVLTYVRIILPLIKGP
jgi:hypothetical protein